MRFSAGFKALHVPYRGPNEALADVITGRIDFYFLPIAPALPLINDGKLVALAVSTANRAAALANVPTTAEAGLKDAAYHFWTGLFAPVETPATSSPGSMTRPARRSTCPPCRSGWRSSGRTRCR